MSWTPKKRYLPLVIAQIGVATTELKDSHLRLKHYDSTNTLFFPDSFSAEDLADAAKVACNAAKTSRLPLDLSFDHYEVDDTDSRPPVDRARARVLHKMHSMEVDRIVSLAKAGDISREALLLIDGSIEFYFDMDRHKEAFRNVVGVAKSFDLHRPYQSGSSAERVGSLISRLPAGHRTPARGTPHRNLTIASWYLRLHGRGHMASLEYPDGVIKIEIFPDDPSHDSPTMDAAKCNRISEQRARPPRSCYPQHRRPLGQPPLSRVPYRALHQDTVPQRPDYSSMPLILLLLINLGRFL